MLFPLPVPSVAEGPPPMSSCWCQQCGEEPCGLGCPEWDTGVWRRDALCSWSFPNTIQLSARFWEMRSFPSNQHSQLGCLQRGVGEEGSPRERSPWQGLGSPVLPNLQQPSLFPPHSLVTAFDPPVIQPLPFGEHPVMGSLTGAGGRGTPWGSVKAERGRVGHKTCRKPQEL